MADQDISTSDTFYSASPVVEDVIPPFFNTTFSTHRVSPLFIGAQALDQTRLDQLAHRLRDTLVGDVVRGIQIGLESLETPAGQVGPLRYVKFRWFSPADVLGDREVLDDAPDRARGEAADGLDKGLWVEIRHENAAYIALLLPGYTTLQQTGSVKPSDWSMRPGRQAADNNLDEARFLHLPLLLLRMPQPLKHVIGDWLSTTFDCRVSKVSLGTKTLVNAWEGWIETMGLSNKGPDFVVTLAFNSPLHDGEAALNSDSDSDTPEATEPGLRSMSVAIPPQDLRRFLRTGKRLPPERRSTPALWERDSRERRRLAGGNTDDGWAWTSATSTGDQPFTAALGRYLQHHLALNLFHPSVRVIQISCGGFVLAQSKLKILRRGDLTDDLSRAAWMFATQLGGRIRGDELPSVFSATQYPPELLKKLKGIEICFWYVMRNRLPRMAFYAYSTSTTFRRHTLTHYLTQGHRGLNKFNNDVKLAHAANVEYPRAAATAIAKYLPEKSPTGLVRFVLASGRYAELDPEKPLWLMSDIRHMKGEIENAVLNLVKPCPGKFEAYAVRPGTVVPESPPLAISLMATISASIKLQQLVKVIVKIGTEGCKNTTFENEEMLTIQ
ncbi:hypothetical protein PWT90_02818 [Aphanocladium album]|nr:hypothetical protein PWT90_02818 [Aphanocladium album]